jgi:hypothetical protein
MRLVHLLILSFLLAACEQDKPQEIPADQLTPPAPVDAFKGLGIRYDGYYMEQPEGLVYLIRFFPEGNVVLINGTSDVADELPSYLVPDAKGDPAMGWYNVPVSIREDSIFFKTYPVKGEISYRGNVPATSMVRLLRHSHINGHRAVKEYIFQPDPSK